jgi:hypothetical protein
VRPLSLAALLLAAASTGCETIRPATCDPSAAGNPTLTYNGGYRQGGVYWSSAPPDGGTPWEGELLLFKGGMHYQLMHGLAMTPAWVQPYLSFDRCGAGSSFSPDGGSCELVDAGGGMLALPAGNQVLILGADATSVTVANDSCADYWLLVVAGVGAAPPPGP